MAKRTVINRAAKAFINTSDDSDLLIESINNTTSNEYQDENERKEVEIIEEIEQNANSEVLDPTPPVEEKKPTNVTDNGEIIDGDFSEGEPTDEASDPY
jgi:recombination protein RecT